MKIVFWVAVLIGLYLVVAYYRGTTSVLSTFSDFVGKTILFLQGRDATGRVSNYPQDNTLGN